MRSKKYDPTQPRTYERKTKTPEQALNSLMALCAKSERASGDALRLMHRWGVDPTDRQKVLQKLIDHKFIDDSRYAEAYVREKSRLSGWGAYKIRRMLSGKGIARDTIDKALGQLDRTDTRGRLAEMLAKKARNTKAATPYDLKGKLLRYGMGLGYDYEDIVSEVEKLIKTDD